VPADEAVEAGVQLIPNLQCNVVNRRCSSRCCCCCRCCWVSRATCCASLNIRCTQQQITNAQAGFKRLAATLQP
jgi:hypothetical protein